MTESASDDTTPFVVDVLFAHRTFACVESRAEDDARVGLDQRERPVDELRDAAGHRPPSAFVFRTLIPRKAPAGSRG